MALPLFSAVTLLSGFCGLVLYAHYRFCDPVSFKRIRAVDQVQYCCCNSVVQIHPSSCQHRYFIITGFVTVAQFISYYFIITGFVTVAQFISHYQSHFSSKECTGAIYKIPKHLLLHNINT